MPDDNHNKPDPMKGFRLLDKFGNKKRDTGVIPRLGLTEERRDELNKRDWTKPNQEAIAANPNTWTTIECKEKQFSGIRVNRVNGMTEIWAAGRMLKDAKTTYIGNDPARLATLMEEAFAIGSVVEIDAPVKRLPRRLR